MSAQKGDLFLLVVDAATATRELDLFNRFLLLFSQLDLVSLCQRQ